MDRQDNLPPHVLIFPLPLQGPINSTFKLAELLCLAGFHISFVLTDYTYGCLVRYTNIQSRFHSYPGFQFKTIWDGLPEDHPRKADQYIELFDSLTTKSRPLFKELLTSGGLSSDNRRPVTCIIADAVLGFTREVANELCLPIIYVSTLSACCLWVFSCLPRLIDAGELPFNDNDLDTLVKSVPGMESFLRRRDLPIFCRLPDLSNPYVHLYKTEGQEIYQAYGLILNTFEELEGPILDYMRTVCPNLYPVGPIHARLEAKLAAVKTSHLISSNSLYEEDKSCIAWLDKQPIKSVIYISFGSIVTMSKDQLMEFWHGLVNSRIRFLWVMRSHSIAGKDWKEHIPVELSEGTRKRGYIVSWAPQEQVLAHSSVGCFLTHSGWNSTLESIYAGVPMLCYPYFIDQQVNSRYVEAIWELGLDIKDTCDRVVVEKMVKELMELRRGEFLQRADQIAKLAKRCSSEDGSSYYNLERLIKDIKSMSANVPSYRLS